MLSIKRDGHSSCPNIMRRLNLLTIPLGTYAGAPLRLHWTWTLFTLFIMFVRIDILPLMLFSYFCVILHEFGHVTAARHLGIGCYSVTLYPIGGLAALDKA